MVSYCNTKKHQHEEEKGKKKAKKLFAAWQL